MKENGTATNKTENKKNSSSSSFTSRLKIIIVIGVIAYAVFMIINQQITLNQLREKQQIKPNTRIKLPVSINPHAI